MFELSVCNMGTGYSKRTHARTGLALTDMSLGVSWAGDVRDDLSRSCLKSLLHSLRPVEALANRPNAHPPTLKVLRGFARRRAGLEDRLLWEGCLEVGPAGWGTMALTLLASESFAPASLRGAKGGDGATMLQKQLLGVLVRPL